MRATNRMDRIDSWGRLFLPNFPLRFVPILNGSNVFASELLVKIMDSFDELRRHVRRALGLGFGLRFRFGYRLRLVLCFRLCLGFGFARRFRFG
jgi:hypothetical protein